VPGGGASPALAGRLSGFSAGNTYTEDNLSVTHHPLRSFFAIHFLLDKTASL
jgi:hypothetical protein